MKIYQIPKSLYETDIYKWDDIYKYIFPLDEYIAANTVNPDVGQFIMANLATNETTGEKLYQLTKDNIKHNKKLKAFKDNFKYSVLSMEYLNWSPRYFAHIPNDELWILEEGDDGWTDPRPQPENEE